MVLASRVLKGHVVDKEPGTPVAASQGDRGIALRKDVLFFAGVAQSRLDCLEQVCGIKRFM